MRNYVPIIFSATVILLFGLLEVLLLRLLNKEWWQRVWIRRAAWGLPGVGVLMVVLWAVAEYHAIGWLRIPAAVLSATVFVLEIALMFSLPVSGVLHQVRKLLDWLFARHRRESKPHLDEKRRFFLKGAAAAVPLATLGLATSGMAGGFSDVVVDRRKLVIPTLPPPLDGLRILHLSDIHLGNFIRLDHLEQVLVDAERHRPDVICATGDIADELELLPEALRMIDQLKPRLGTYVSMGNHEYFRGPERFKRICDSSPASLLIDTGLTFKLDDARLFLAGIDDPRRMHAATPEFFESRLARIVSRRSAADLSLLMSHRPSVFPHAAAANFHLTLAGHTHGAQMGVAGRSLIEPLAPEGYLWGLYRDGSSHLYTSSGVGHWFPFRLGCPPEAPVFELVRS